MIEGKDLTKGKEFSVILKFATPMLIGNIFQQLYLIIDTAIVGKFIGTEALAATGVVFPILFMLSSFVIGFAIGATILISQYYGAKKIDKVILTSENLQIVMFFLAIIVTVLGILFSKQIFILLNFPKEHIHLAVIYFNTLMIGNIAIFEYNAIVSILRGLGDSKTPVYFLIISTIVNISCDLFFVLVLKKGIQGVAWATVIAYISAYLIAVLYLNKKHKILKIKFKPKLNKFILKKIFKLSIPSSMQLILVSLANIIFFAIINVFGTNVIAGYTSASKINSFALMPAMFFSNALTAFVGQNYGANKINRILNGLKETLKIISIISIAFTIIALLFPENLMKLFTNDNNVIQIGKQYFKIVSPFYISFGIMFVLNAVYRGTGDTIKPMYFSFIALWLVRFPAAILLSMKINLHPFELVPKNHIYLWWSEPLGWTAGLILSAFYFFSYKWLKN